VANGDCRSRGEGEKKRREEERGYFTKSVIKNPS
jgi:hypothetical protein